ncbi:MAG: beta strand repeat-containing protein [Alphaproteobacteria bacterium]
MSNLTYEQLLQQAKDNKTNGFGNIIVNDLSVYESGLDKGTHEGDLAYNSSASEVIRTERTKPDCYVAIKHPTTGQYIQISISGSATSIDLGIYDASLAGIKLSVTTGLFVDIKFDIANTAFDHTGLNDILKLEYFVMFNGEDNIDPAFYNGNVIIHDDAPIANDDGEHAVADNAVTVNIIGDQTDNVIAAGEDILTADDAQVSKLVVKTGDGHETILNIARGSTTLSSATIVDGDGNNIGVITYNPTTGGLTYDPVDSIAANAGLDRDISVVYTITDQDGDSDTATVSFDAEPSITIDPDNPVGANDDENQVDESALANGSHTPTGGTIIATGDVFVTNASKVVITNEAGHSEELAVGLTIAGPNGTLKITSFDKVTGKFEYEYILSQNINHSLTDHQDIFTITVTDASNDTATGNIIVNITDDAPIAIDDGTVTLLAGGTGHSVDLLDNDTQGADGADVLTSFKVTLPDGSTQTVNLSSGSATITSNGIDLGVLSFNQSTNKLTYIAAATAQDSDDIKVLYTVRDSDGDEASATVIFDVSAENPEVNIKPDTGTNEVHESGLLAGHAGSGVAGSQVGVAAYVTEGTISIEDATGFSIDGTNITGSQVTITGTYGTLVLNRNQDGSYDYTYTLNKNANHTGNINVVDDFDIIAHSTSGVTATASLDVNIIDDAPTGDNDTMYFIGTALGTISSIDIFGNGHIGADGGTITNFEFAFLQGFDGGASYNYEVVKATAAEVADGISVGSMYLIWDANSHSMVVRGNEGTAGSLAYNYTVVDSDGDTYQVGESIVGNNYLDYLKQDVAATGNGYVGTLDDNGYLISHAGGVISDVASCGTGLAYMDSNATIKDGKAFEIYEDARNGSAVTDLFETRTLDANSTDDSDYTSNGTLTINGVNIYNYETATLLVDKIIGDYGTLHIHQIKSDVGGFEFSTEYIANTNTTGDMDSFIFHLEGDNNIEVDTGNLTGQGQSQGHNYVYHIDWEYTVNYVLDANSSFPNPQPKDVTLQGTAGYDVYEIASGVETTITGIAGGMDTLAFSSHNRGDFTVDFSQQNDMIIHGNDGSSIIFDDYFAGGNNSIANVTFADGTDISFLEFLMYTPQA